MKKLKRADVYNDPASTARLKRNKPVYKLDHVVKERYLQSIGLKFTIVWFQLTFPAHVTGFRYPTFADAVRDLDDCLSMCYLFATFSKSKSTPERIVRLCRRLTGTHSLNCLWLF